MYPVGCSKKKTEKTHIGYEIRHNNCLRKHSRFSNEHAELVQTPGNFGDRRSSSFLAGGVQLEGRGRGGHPPTCVGRYARPGHCSSQGLRGPAWPEPGPLHPSPCPSRHPLLPSKRSQPPALWTPLLSPPADTCSRLALRAAF